MVICFRELTDSPSKKLAAFRVVRTKAKVTVIMCLAMVPHC